MELTARYQGLDAFYEADPRRKEYDQFNFGVMWSDGVGSCSYWRLTWLEGTGEVYAYDVTSRGRVVVLATRLRHSAVQRALAGWERAHALSWARRAVMFPVVTGEFSGYVSQPEKQTVWVVRNGWWEYPLPLTPSTLTRRGESIASCFFDIPDNLYMLADSILADYFS